MRHLVKFPIRFENPNFGTFHAFNVAMRKISPLFFSLCLVFTVRGEDSPQVSDTDSPTVEGKNNIVISAEDGQKVPSAPVSVPSNELKTEGEIQKTSIGELQSLPTANESVESKPASQISNQDLTPIAETTSPTQLSQEADEVAPTPKKIKVRVTFYSGQDDQWGSRVAWSKIERAKKGRTIAADPNIFPYGTWIEVPGFGKLRVEDTGTDVKSKKASNGEYPVIDIYVENEEEVLRLAACSPEYIEIVVLDT